MPRRNARGRVTGRGGRKGNGGNSGARGRGRGSFEIQRREGNWTDGSGIGRNNREFTPSPTASKADEILRFLLLKEDPATVEEIVRNMGSYATMDDVNNSLAKLLDEKKVAKMPNDQYAPNVVKSVMRDPVEMSMMNDDPAVLGLKSEEFGSSEGASSLGFNPQMDIDDIQQDGQFSDEDDDDDDDDDFEMDMKDEGWGVNPFCIKTESNPEDFETENGSKDEKVIKTEEESQLGGEEMASEYLYPGSSQTIKQEFVENQVCPKEISLDSLKHEAPMDSNDIIGSEKYDDSHEKPQNDLPEGGMDVSYDPKTSEHNIKDKVLLAFTKMVFQTGAIFVLKTKLDCEISNLEEVLKELKSAKLVGLTDKLWTLTPDGEAYLKIKGLWTKCETSVGMGRGRIMKPRGTGPPQSPLKLVTSDKVFGAGVEKAPVPAATYQPEKVNNIQVFPTQSKVSSIPSLMDVNTTYANSNFSLKTTSNNLYSTPNVTNSFNKPIIGGSLNVSSNISDNRLPNTLATSVDKGIRFQIPAPQKSHTIEEKPFTKPKTPAELARMENEGLSGRTDQKNPNSWSSSNFHTAPSHSSGQPSSSSSLTSTYSSPSLHQSQSSSPSGYPSPLSTSSSTMVPAQLASLNSSASSSLLTSNLNDNLMISTESFSAVNKNPISALMEYAQSRQQQAKIEVVSQRGPSHKPTFIIAAMIGKRIFPGVKSRSKKDGRTEAADLALRILLSEGQYNINSEPSKSNSGVSSSANGPMTHFDKMAALSHQAFNQLIASIPEKFAGRKVIAALILKRSATDTGTVISVGSGNRCITGEELSLEGNTVNDSHAEIITRRGFIRFLYKQLETYTINQPHEFFEEGSSGKLRIKANFTLHLYISTAPCGDGALFSPRDATSNKGPVEDVENHLHNPTFTSNVQGVLRTKMEGGEGTIPIESDFTVQTWDGIVRGERLRTMSCTDKICRWNVVGMQGALLSHLIEPVYLNSLTLGYLYDHGHLARAVCCRVGKGEPDINSQLPSGYQLNHPWLGRMTACEPQRETQKTKALSINWCLGDERPEVIDGTTGRCYTGVERTIFSRMRKKELYTSFRSVCTKFGLSDLLSAKTYLDAKKMATDFQAAKNVMLKRLKNNGFSIWVSKPMEEEMFSC